jgi:elongation factor Ts
MKVTAEMVKQLRERTGVSMSKCKEALDTTGGDMEKAIDHLRKTGIASAVKKEGRETKEGVIGFAETPKAIALLEMNTETDFVAQNERFKKFVHELCKEAAEAEPSSLEDFLHQKLSHDPSTTVDQARSLLVQSLGENIQCKRLLLLKKRPDASLGVYSHMGGKIVTVVELEGASDQAALAREIAMHVAAESPDYLSPEDINPEVKVREKEIALSQIQGKPPAIAEKIVEGKMKSFYEQTCLLNQKYIKDTSVTVAEFVEMQSKKHHKPFLIRRFLRWKVGE